MMLAASRPLVGVGLSVASSCRRRLSTPTTSSLVKWTSALQQLDARTRSIVYDDDAEQRKEKYVQALLGDKILGRAVVAKLVVGGDVVRLDSGSISKRLEVAVSNRFMAENVCEILPDFSALLSSDRRIGTAVEAAVSAVDKIDHDAVVELAEFLIDRSGEMIDPNCKGRLVGLGGIVTVTNAVVGPIFTAKAELRGETATAQGPSKKRAENLAAAHLLERTVGESSTLLRRDGEERSLLKLPVTHDLWQPLDKESWRCLLRNGESAVDWWRRGAMVRGEAFRRAVLAPMVFPDAVHAVDVWVRRPPQDAAVLMVIIDGQSRYHTLPVETAASTTQARKVIGLKANQIIADLAGVELPPPKKDGTEDDDAVAPVKEN